MQEKKIYMMRLFFSSLRHKSTTTSMDDDHRLHNHRVADCGVGHTVFLQNKGRRNGEAAAAAEVVLCRRGHHRAVLEEDSLPCVDEEVCVARNRPGRNSRGEVLVVSVHDNGREDHTRAEGHVGHTRRQKGIHGAAVTVSDKGLARWVALQQAESGRGEKREMSEGKRSNVRQQHR